MRGRETYKIVRMLNKLIDVIYDTIDTIVAEHDINLVADFDLEEEEYE